MRSGDGARHAGVSIHARHYWRAMRGATKSCGCLMKVSIHARHYWRAMRRFAVLRSCAQHVSIHARHYWRAMRVESHSALFPTLFQSTPAITGGRCCEVRAAQVVTNVSIHARHYWRAMHSMARPFACISVSFNPRPPLLAGDASRWLTLAASSCCFNPRPPLLAGDAHAAALFWYEPREVSIHARHYWRAMPR